jgi:hypothetical protein
MSVFFKEDIIGYHVSKWSDKEATINAGLDVIWILENKIPINAIKTIVNDIIGRFDLEDLTKIKRKDGFFKKVLCNIV